MKILLAGFGSLGLRHLQSILSLDASIDIIEPSKTNIEANLNQINKSDIDNVIFHENMELISGDYDFCIISTSSKPRLQLIRELQLKAKWDYLILEKFLFPQVEDYKIFEREYKYDLENVYVNCPRRYYPDYKNLKQDNQSKIFIGMHVYGINWGMSTNGIHFLDLFSYLSSERLEVYKVDSLKKIKSKRDGYDELEGNMTFKSKNGYIKLSSTTNNSSKESFEIEIKFKDKTYIIDEISNLNKILINDEEHLKSFNPIFQSNLTSLYIEDLIKFGYANLPKYLESRYDHLVFLESIKGIKGLYIT